MSTAYTRRFFRGLLLATPVIASFLYALPVRAGDDGANGVESEVTVSEQRPRRPNLPATFGSSDIRGWYAPDSLTLIIDTYAHGKFKATFANSCQGIRFAESLGFSTMGPFELDSSTRVVLPDGQQCFFKDLVRYSEEQEKQDRAARPRKASAGD